MFDLVHCRVHALDSSANERLQTLERIVLDLMMEIEALRATVIELSSRIGPTHASDDALDDGPAGVSGPHTIYGRAYLETAWRSHLSAGPSCGWDKILEQFYGDECHGTAIDVEHWRELLMLRRLGYSEAQLTQYVQQAQAAEACT